MGNKTKKELEDEYFLQLEQDMKKQGDESDEVFGFNYLKEDKNKSLKKNWYEILIICLFIILGILSIYFEWHFHVIIVRVCIMFFLAGFSEKADIPIKRKYHIFYNIWFYKTKWLYTTLIIISIIFLSIYYRSVNGFEALVLLVLIPISGLVGLFLGRFTTEIIKFIHNVIKGEKDNNKGVKKHTNG